MHTKALPYVLLLSLFWGTNIVASRFGIDDFDPVVFIALRLSIATFFFVLIFMLQKRAWPLIQVCGAMQPLAGSSGSPFR